MEYRQLGNSSLRVSVLTLGTWPIGTSLDQRCFDHVLMAAIDAGINLIDTADVYGFGAMEEALGEHIRDLRRAQVLIATKGGAIPGMNSGKADLSAVNLRKSLESSLKRLRIDCIDLYQLHGPDSGTDWDDTLAELQKFNDEGKVRYFGYSNFPSELIAICQYRAFEKNSPFFASRQTFTSVVAKASQREPEQHVSDIGLLAYGCLAGGRIGSRGSSLTLRMNHYAGLVDAHKVECLKKLGTLLGRSELELALGWIVRASGVCSAIVGMTSPEQIRQNVLAVATGLTDDALEAIRAIHASPAA